jgi:hypothetical protein
MPRTNAGLNKTSSNVRLEFALSERAPQQRLHAREILTCGGTLIAQITAASKARAICSAAGTIVRAAISENGGFSKADTLSSRAIRRARSGGMTSLIRFTSSDLEGGGFSGPTQQATQPANLSTPLSASVLRTN